MTELDASEIVDLEPIAPQTNPDGSLHPQERALLSTANIIGYGGEAGSAKSWTGVYFTGRWNHVPGYGALVTRRDTTQLTGPGSVWEKARKMYRAWGADTIENPHVAKWDNGANVVFMHCQFESSVDAHDSKEYGAIFIDEAQYYSERMIWYFWGRCRTAYSLTHPDSPGPRRPQMMLGHNPDPDCYLRTLFDWWIDADGWAIEKRCGQLRWCLRVGDELKWFEGGYAEGKAYCDELRRLSPGPATEHMAPISVTFIHGKLSDNRILLAQDPTYGARVAMQDAVTRAKKQGNWNARASSGSLFNRGWFNVIDCEPDPSQVQVWVRGWDKAGSAPSPTYPDPDWSACVKIALLKNGRYVFCDVQRVRLEPGGVDQWMSNIVRTDGPRVIQAVWQDPAQSGKVDIEQIKRVMRAALSSVVIEVEVEREDKIVYASLVSAAIDPRSRANQILADVVAGPWNQPFFGEIEAFPPPSKGKKDQVDAMSRAYLHLHQRKSGFKGSFLASLRRERM